ncbi:MAG: drug resistance transporter, EmrB/QacA subfamily [Solirubrobacterales bacterium]|jgi:EmrB/QacA subfamily drug resistance transporter|nr:drug resistance transporter, EmrB/QacA subfamily [Solirubrobacterales bacterium]
MTDTQNPHHAKRWWILAVIGIAQLMVVLDATIVNIALPTAQQDLGFSDDNRQWIVTAYALAFGSLLLLGGRLGDFFGRKRIFVVGLLGFAIASAIGGTAQSFEVLVASRALQGVFGALLAPGALSLLSTTFTRADERGKAFGIFGAIGGGGAGVGLLLGGVLTEYLSWRWCLYVNLAFAIPAAIGALALLHDEAPEVKPRIDIPGTVTATAGLFALVYGFSHAETTSWSNTTTIVSLIVAVVLLVAFVMLQLRSTHPLLPMRVVLDRYRGASYLGIAISGAGMFGVFLFLTYYLQQNLGYSPVTTGLAFLPMVGAIMITATASTSSLVPRFGPRPLVVLGMLLGAVGLVCLAQLGTTATYAIDILPGLLLMGAGMGLIFAPAISTATLGVEPRDAGVASAMVNTGQQVGGSVGTALLSTLSASAVSSYLVGKGSSPQVAAEAAVHGYTTAFWVSAGIFLVGAIVTGLIFPSGVPEADPAAEPVLVH